MFERLCWHQDRVIAIVTGAEAMLTAGRDVDPASLGQACWALTRALTTYQLFKHRELFRPVIQRGSPEQARTARQMQADCIALGEAFRTYATRWNAADILADWATYHPESLAMIGRIREHLRRERLAARAFALIAATPIAPARAAALGH